MVAVYSTFLQRAYDMLLHDVALDRLHVVLAVDRAGLVGEDGETHHGVFDVSYLNSVPGMRVYAPANFAELKAMLEEAVLRWDGPAAVRYPRGGEGGVPEDSGRAPAAVLQRGPTSRWCPTGWRSTMLQAAQLLEERGVEAEVVKLNIITPLDAAPVLDSVPDGRPAGGGGQRLRRQRGGAARLRWSRPASAPGWRCAAPAIPPPRQRGRIEAAPGTGRSRAGQAGHGGAAI